MSAMAMREIRVVGDPVLRTRCEPITERDARVRSLVEDLLETVDAEGRAGLVRARGEGGPGRQGGRRRGNRADGACPAARVRPPGRYALPRPPRAVRAQEGDARDARAAHRELIRPPTAVRAGAPRA